MYKPSEISKQNIVMLIEYLRNATVSMVEPMVISLKKEFGPDPFLILISCLLSLRSRDTITLPICRDLFALARTPQEILNIPQKKIEKLLYKLGFYRRKAYLLHTVSQEIIERFSGKVPSTQEELLTIKGVGKKTANLVLGQGFDIPALCVDTHVHRISNRLGLVTTKTPDETEEALKKILPKKYWIEFNSLLVMWGQNICVPISPKCSICVIFPLCARKGVTRSR